MTAFSLWDHLPDVSVSAAWARLAAFGGGLFPNAYLIEVIQTLMSFVATLVLIWAAYDAGKDALGLPSDERFGPRGILAIGNIHRAAFRLLGSFILTISGVVSIFLPPPPPAMASLFDSPDLRFGSFIVRGAMIVLTAIILVDAFAERFFRQRYIRSLRATLEDKAPRQYLDRRRDTSPVPRPHVGE
jgi:hypothetical protein